MRIVLFGFLIASTACLTVISYIQIIEQQGTLAETGQTPVLFAQQVTKQQAQLDQAIRDYQRALEYMTFRSERKKLEQKWLKALRQKINLTPHNAPAWQTLASVEYQIEAPSADRQFSIQRALAYNNWDHRRKPNLIHLCLQQDQSLTQITAQQCDALLLSYRWNPNLEYQAKKLRVTPDRLAAKLSALGIIK